MSKLVYQFQAEGTFRDEPYSPYTLDRVEIEEKSGTAVETIQPSNINRRGRGLFEADVDKTLYDDNTDYVARWFYKKHGVTYESTQFFDPVVIGVNVQITFTV